VYDWVLVGLRLTTLPVNAPGFVLYVNAPFSVKVATSPAQINVLLAATVIVGVVLTFSVTWVVLVQPAALMPCRV
jgi:hypothetical protein